MIYICPSCDKEMVIYQEYSLSNLEPDYVCKVCDLYYLTEFTMDDKFTSGRLETMTGDLIVSGTFNYCYRIYKLKVFI